MIHQCSTIVHRIAAVVLLHAATGALLAAERLAVFECRERLDRDWPRTLVIYEREFPAGIGRMGALRVVETPGIPGLAGVVEQHGDMTQIAAAGQDVSLESIVAEPTPAN